MLKSLVLLILSLFSVVLVANSNIDTLYLKASFEKQPDSVKILELKEEAIKYFNSNFQYSLSLIDEVLKIPMNTLSPKQRAEVMKFTAYGYINSSNKKKGLSLLKNAEKAYLELNNNIEMAFIYNMFFMYYMQESKCDSVIYYYQKAIERLNLVKNKSSYFFSAKSIINTNIGNFFYFKRDDYDKAAQFYDTALYYAELNNDSMRIAASYSNIGMVLISKDKYEEAKKYYEKAYKLSIALGNRIYTGNILANLGNLYDKMGDFNNAIKYKLKALSIFKEVGNEFLLFKSERLLANEYIKTEKLLIARNHLLQILKDTASVPLDEQISLFSSLTDLYKGLKNTDSALYYHEVYSNLLLREQILKNHKATEELIIAHKTQQALKDKQLLELEYETQNKRLIVSIIFSIILVIVIVLLVLILNQRKKLQIARRREIESENIFLKEKIEFKNKELTISTMNIIRHSEFVSSLVPDLKEFYKNANNKNKQLIMNIVQKINVHNKTELWDDFLRTFTEVNSSFFEILDEKFPKMTVKERKLCALLKLEMSTKDIASITNMSTRGVETARLRLRKKLNLKTEDSLYVFLRQIG